MPERNKLTRIEQVLWEVYRLKDEPPELHLEGTIKLKAKKILENYGEADKTLHDFVNWLVLEDDYIEADESVKPEMVQSSLKFLLKKIEKYNGRK